MHFAVMQLHQLNFFGFEKPSLNIPGVPILLMSLGMPVVDLHRARMRRAQSATVSRETGCFLPVRRANQGGATLH